MMRLPYGSASSLQRGMACPASMVLAHVDRGTSPAAERGTLLHRFLEHVHADRAKALAALPDDLRAYAAALDLTDLPVGLTSEVAFAWDTVAATSRLLGRGMGRDYSQLLSHEIPGTPDVVGVSPDRVYVGDWKFGRSHVPAPDENMQARFNALCAARHYKRDLAVVEIVRFHEDPTKPPTRLATEMSAGELEDMVGKLRRYVQAVNKADHTMNSGRTPDVYEGTHCEYCPAFQACPAKTSLLKQLGDVKATYRTARDLKRWNDIAWKQLGDAAKTAPVPVGDGRVWGPVETTEEVWDPVVVWAIVYELHGTEAADLAVERSASKASIERALSTCVSPEHLVAVTKDTLAAIRKSGGAKTVKKTRNTERKAS